jgi:predicted transcriptional regulator
MSTFPRPRLAHIRAADAMHPGVLSCTSDLPLSDVARIMAEHRVHCVVVEEPGADTADSWTVVSDIDLVAAAAADRLDEPVAGRVAATWVPQIDGNESLMRAAQLMAERDVSHLVVVGAATGRPEGILSTLDVAAVLSSASS